MALLTVAKLVDQVLFEIPGKEQAPIVYALNLVVRRIQNDFVEPIRATFTTRATYATGTISVTQDSTSVTFSGTPLLSADPVMLLQVEGDSEWFVLTYVSTSTGTLSSKWAGATNATATFTIAYPTVSFPAGVGRVLKIQRYGYTPLVFNVGGGCPSVSGTPMSWSPYYHDPASASPNDDLLRFYLNPAPDSRVVYSYWYSPRTAELDTAGATTQVVPLPDIWNEAVLQGVLFWLWKQEARSERALVQSALYEAALARARGSASSSSVLIPERTRVGLYGFEQRPIGQ